MGKHRREDDQLTARQVAIRLSEALGRPTGRNDVMKLIEGGELKAEEIPRGETVYYYVRAADVYDYVARRLRGRAAESQEEKEEPEKEMRIIGFAAQGWSREQGIGHDLKEFLPDDPAVKILMKDGDPSHQQLVSLKDEINKLAAEYRKEGKTEEAEELAGINKRIRRLERKARPVAD